MRAWVCGLAAVAALLAGASQGRAGFIVYTSQAAFEAAVGGVTRQDFSAAGVADGSQALVTGPLTSATSNAVFSPGDINARLTISSTGSSDLGNMLYIPGVGTVGNSVRGVYTNGSNATLSLTFDPAVSSAGLTLLAFTNNTGPRAFVVEVLGSSSTTPQLFFPAPLPTSGSGTFLGFVGTGGEEIQRISFQPSLGANIGVLGVEFPSPAPPEPPVAPSPVPEPATLGACALMGVAGCGYVRRRLKAQPAAA